MVDGVRWSVPGDHARIEDDGTITLLGRGSVSINTGGEKVYPEEVEAALKSHPAVFDAVVVGRARRAVGRARRRRRAAPRRAPRPQLDELDAHVREHVAGYKAPRDVVLVDEIVRSPSGQARLPLGEGRPPPNGSGRAPRARPIPCGAVNRLAGETSPYLRQHADNPVDWYPWGDEAFDRARAEDKPILLSVGYSSCHWCHVMAHESFEDPDVAAVMNDLLRQREGRPRGAARRRRASTCRRCRR